MRTHYCGLTTEELLGQTVSLCGWVHRRRDHGGVIFIDLRDREGLVQIVCHPDNAAVFKAAEAVRNEFCLRITGVVNNRLAGTVNQNLKSGKIEVVASAVEVLNPSVTPPFQLDDDNLSETTRLTHRVLDLRRLRVHLLDWKPVDIDAIEGKRRHEGAILVDDNGWRKQSQKGKQFGQ